MQPTRRRRLIIAAALAAVGVAVVAAMAIAAQRGASAAARAERGVCPSADEAAEQRSVKQLRKSVRCLINDERESRGVKRLKRDKGLQHVGSRHAEVMVDTDCLAHQCEGEDDLETRLREAGYFDGAEMWQFAENTGCGLSAEAMVANWMDTKFHRVNILERRFREVGVGVVQKRVKGRCEKGYATFAVLLGWRDGGGTGDGLPGR